MREGGQSRGSSLRRCSAYELSEGKAAVLISHRYAELFELQAAGIGEGSHFCHSDVQPH